MSDRASVVGSDTVLPVLHLVVPGLDGVGPAVFIAGGGKVLTTVTGCRWRKTGI